ncbi:hypothetical protein LXL04_019433 [Taraxacum kok-saghyz]
MRLGFVEVFTFDFGTEMKNRVRQEEYDAPSFNITDFDSPSEMKNLELQEEYDDPSFNITDFDSTSGTRTKVVSDGKIVSVEALEQADDIENSASHGEAGNSRSQKITSSEDELPAADQRESSASIGGPVTSHMDNLTSEHVSVKRQKVKIQGRRRLCKVAVKDEEEEKEDEIFQDVESDFTAAVSDFDSPVPVKTTENKRESGNISHPTTSNFKEKYESAILHGNDKNAFDRDKRIGSAVAQDLRNCVQPYFLRRLKNEVFRGDSGTNTAKLSKKNEIIVWLNV